MKLPGQEKSLPCNFDPKMILPGHILNLEFALIIISRLVNFDKQLQVLPVNDIYKNGSLCLATFINRDLAENSFELVRVPEHGINAPPV